MKKCFYILAAVLTGIAAFAPVSRTAERGASAASVRGQAYAAYAETAPDVGLAAFGEIDPVWNAAEAYYTDDGHNTYAGYVAPWATGYWKAMWDEGNLYLLAVVSDSRVARPDAVNFFVSEGDTFAEDWNASEGDYILIVNPYAEIGYYKGRHTDGLEARGGAVAAGLTDGGYAVSARIPFFTGVDARVGYRMGIDVSINDFYPGDTQASERKAYCDWYQEEITDNGYYWIGTVGLGTLTFAPPADTLPPVISVDGEYPQATVGTPLALKLPGISDDRDGAITDYAVAVKTAAGADVTASVYDSAAKTLVFSEAGIYTVVYSAVDRAGNVGTLTKSVTAAHPSGKGCGCGKPAALAAAVGLLGAFFLKRRDA